MGWLLTVALSYLWLPGLDIVREVYDGPTLVGIVGYDRDTHRASWIQVSAGCYWTFSWHPEPNQGGITHIIHRADLGPRTFALLHESGFIRDEQIPDALWCIPLTKP